MDATFIFGTYSLESFEFLLRGYTIGLKENCFSYMEDRIAKLVKYLSYSPIEAYLVGGISEKQNDKAREFLGRQAANLFEVHKIMQLRMLLSIKKLDNIYVYNICM